MQDILGRRFAERLRGQVDRRCRAAAVGAAESPAPDTDWPAAHETAAEPEAARPIGRSVPLTIQAARIENELGCIAGGQGAVKW